MPCLSLQCARGGGRGWGYGAEECCLPVSLGERHVSRVWGGAAKSRRK